MLGIACEQTLINVWELFQISAREEFKEIWGNCEGGGGGLPL